jgi:hypothetical protein
MVAAGEKSSTKTAIRPSLGLTEKKLIFDAFPGTVVSAKFSPVGFMYLIVVLPLR